MADPKGPDETLIEFPAELSIKAIGLASDDFESLVFDIVAKHVDSSAQLSVSQLQSSKGKYVSVRVQLTAHSHDQLKAIYADLHAHERVLFML